MAVSRIKVVASGSVGAANGGNPAGALGFTPKAGDLNFVAGGNTGSSGTAGVSTASYTELTAINNVGAQFVRGAWKAMNGSENSFTGRGSGGGDDAMQYSWVVLRGVDTTTPLDGVTQVSVQADATPNADPASITPATAGAAVLQFLSLKLNSTSSIVKPDNYSLLTQGVTDDANPHATALAIQLDLPASAENAGAWTHDAADFVAMGWVLRPRTVVTIHVDQTLGNDTTGDGSIGTPYKTLAKAASVALMGDTIALKRGETWAEQLTIPTDDITVTAYGTGANPIIDGEDSRIGIYTPCENTVLENIDFFECTVGALAQGTGASFLSITGCNADRCGTGYASGGGSGGGWITAVSNCTGTNSRLAIGAADGLQFGEDSTAGQTATIDDFTGTGCEITGINVKIGTVTITNSYLAFNESTGLTVQTTTPPNVTIEDSTLEGNNAGDLGVFNVGLENTATLTMRRCLSKNPADGAGTYHISQTGASTLVCEACIFVSDTDQNATTAVIRSNTGANAATLSLTNNTFVVSDGTATVVNADGATNITITRIKNNIFKTAASRALWFEAAMLTAAGNKIDYNLYDRADNGEIILADGDQGYDVGELADATTDYVIEGNGVEGDPDFSSTVTFLLNEGSPALDAGVTGLVTTDFDGDTYGNPPNIGAQADAGVAAAVIDPNMTYVGAISRRRRR